MRHRQYSDLHGREPRRERATKALDEKRNEALVRAERRAMNAERHGRSARWSPVAPTEPCRLNEVELRGAQRLLGAPKRSNLDVDLRAVERRVTDAGLVVHTARNENVAQHAFRPQPRALVDDVFAAGIAWIAQRQAKSSVVDPEE